MDRYLLIVLGVAGAIGDVVAKVMSACDTGVRCTGAFDVLARSIQYGIFGFTFTDYTYFCL